MDVFVTKECARLARRAGLPDNALLRAVADASRGLIDADLGGGLIKQRVAGFSSGKSRGSRAIIFFVVDERAVFLHLFAKSAKPNLSPVELQAYREFAWTMRGLSSRDLNALIETRGWRRIGP